MGSLFLSVCFSLYKIQNDTHLNSRLYRGWLQYYHFVGIRQLYSLKHQSQLYQISLSNKILELLSAAHCIITAQSLPRLTKELNSSLVDCPTDAQHQNNN